MSISSPPYPGETHPSAMYGLVGEFHSWLSDLRGELDNVRLAGSGMPLPAVPPLAARAVYDSLTVRCHYANWQGLRALREAWDAVLRMYETVWESEPAVRARIQMFLQGLAFLGQSSKTFEHREAVADAALHGGILQIEV